MFKFPLTNGREIAAYFVAHIAGIVFTRAFSAAIFDYIGVTANAVGTRLPGKMNADQAGVISLFLTVIVILAVLGIFLFIRKALLGRAQTETTNDREIAAYLAAHVLQMTIALNVLVPMYQANPSLGSVGLGIGLILMVLMFGAFLLLRRLLARDDDWLVSHASGANTIFKIRQRRFDRCLKLGYLVAAALACVYLIACLIRADWNAAVTAPGLGALLATVAIIAGIFPALWSLKEAGLSTFVISSDGVVFPGHGSKTIQLAWPDLAGPYYSVAGELQPTGGSAVYIGTGVSGMAYVGAHAASGALTETVKMGINVVRSGTRGRVFVEHRGKRVDLACLLAAHEAEFLCSKVAEAARRATSQSATPSRT